jgi:hypothetical protein
MLAVMVRRPSFRDGGGRVSVVKDRRISAREKLQEARILKATETVRSRKAVFEVSEGSATQEDPNSSLTLPIRAISTVDFNPSLTFV